MGTNAATLNLGARPPRAQFDAPRGEHSEPIWLNYFILSAGGILLVGALVRFIIAAGSDQALSLPEPLMGLPLRYAMFAVGAVELVVALICLFGKRVGLQLGWLAWLATNYLVFWVALVWQHCSPQATCIGSLTDPFRLSRGITGIVLQIIPVCLCFGSYALLISLWFKRRIKPAGLVAEPVETIKMFCALCNGHISFSPANLGQKIPCPHCHATITLMRQKNVKTSCPSCGEHIEFPLHGLGQIIPCPHCTVPVTLQLPV